VDPATIEPSPFAYEIAQQGRKDARHYEVVLRQSRRVVRMDRGVLITETKHGLICANAGVDESNVGGGEMLTLLPEAPDASAAGLRASLARRSGATVAVIISDTFGRPWRVGQVNVAIGVAGIAPVRDYIGQYDPYGYELHVSVIAIADELASAAELVMGKIDRVPVAIIRGFAYTPTDGNARSLIRDAASDLFR
jgi:coenzyme F420-0:L-glutamate ligase/coenzyme F420-1:gamma-L-glutamate ligase